MKIKTLQELKKRTSKVLSYMDAYYGCDIMYGRITLTRSLLSDIYEKDIPLDDKISLAQKLINKTAYIKNDKFKLM